MGILKVQNIGFGEKCYIKFDGAIRECIFNGTRTTDKGVAMMLNIAQVGNRNVLFPRFETFDSWYHGGLAKLPIYKTLDDAKANRFMVGYYGEADNCYNSKFIQPFYKNVSVCNCGGSNYAWWWNGVDAVNVFISLPNGYIDDANGFRFIGGFKIVGYVNNHLRIIFKEVSENELYLSKERCCAEHKPKVVTF